VNNPSSFLAKAGQAVESARVLHSRGDLEGAVNRACYACFHAAHGALAHFGDAAQPAKTHSTIIAQFSRHLVQTGRIAAEHGRFFNRCHQLRNPADYDVASIDDAKTVAAVDGAAALVAAVQAMIGTP
jgi:uncharacterized protein (UPF0332 family)